MKVDRKNGPGQRDHVEHQLVDAWQLNLSQPVDAIAGNGLNIYEPDDNRCVELYKKIYANLKDGGAFITSFLTVPHGEKSEWDHSLISQEALEMQHLYIKEVVGARWQNFRTSKQVVNHLSDAGFNDIKIIWDKARIFPTIVGYKR